MSSYPTIRKIEQTLRFREFSEIAKSKCRKLSHFKNHEFELSDFLFHKEKQNMACKS